MKRSQLMNSIIKNSDKLDFIVIGGGATRLGIRLEASTQGYPVVLLEQDDFIKGTSIRNTSYLGVHFETEKTVEGL
ncbi:hypothetical protein JYT50_00810 [bacterium AH-315-A23]|nr:hypothetical protein [bacterium AH-315-A23]